MLNHNISNGSAPRSHRKIVPLKAGATFIWLEKWVEMDKQSVPAACGPRLGISQIHRHLW
jgi:hypothetical protein